MRRAKLAAGSVAEVVKRAGIARQLETLPGFTAYQVMDCGDGDLMAVSHFRDRTSAEQSDELAARFAQDDLQRFDLKRNEWFGGGVILVRREADARPSRASTCSSPRRTTRLQASCTGCTREAASPVAAPFPCEAGVSTLPRSGVPPGNHRGVSGVNRT